MQKEFARERENLLKGQTACFVSGDILNKYFHDFKSKRILIVGDAIIDTYLWGEIHRMSPEAPVPVVDVDKILLEKKIRGLEHK